MSARDTILNSLKEKTGDLKKSGPPALSEELFRLVDGGMGIDEMLQLFKEKLENLGGEVLVPVERGEVAGVVKGFVEKEGVESAVVDDEYYDQLKECVSWAVRVSEADKKVLFEVDLGITGTSQAVAETGTIIIDYGKGRGRLASLAPPLHLVILKMDNLVGDLIDAVGKFGEGSGSVWITGPSKTADIGGIMIRGIHGPGRIVILPVK